MSPGLRHSPLDAEHRALGARMVEFGGWEMPIQYTGVLEEHRSCREDAVVFDVSHLGSVRVAGPGGRSLLQWLLTNDLGKIAPGRAQYTHLLDADDAHVVDDIIVWWVAPEDFLVMPNASNTARITGAMLDADAAAHTDGEVGIADITADRAVLAVQGPHARDRLAALSRQAATVERFAVAEIEWEGARCVVAGTGYTGEPGVEIHVPAAAAADLWRAVTGAGITPAGLGARDTLRLEAGLPLHGHELGPGITPLQAGLGWVVAWGKGEFRGRAPLEAERDRGLDRTLRGLVVDGRRPPREGYAVCIDGEVAGVVTSGNFSPTLQRGIALAFLPPSVGEGAAVTIDARGSALAATVVRPPFVRPPSERGPSPGASG